eukprot:7904143-Pyramimonas_sp.AAC.2
MQAPATGQGAAQQVVETQLSTGPGSQVGPARRTGFAANRKRTRAGATSTGPGGYIRTRGHKRTTEMFVFTSEPSSVHLGTLKCSPRNPQVFTSEPSSVHFGTLKCSTWNPQMFNSEARILGLLCVPGREAPASEGSARRTCLLASPRPSDAAAAVGPAAQAHLFGGSCPVTGERVETLVGALSAAFAERVAAVLVTLYKTDCPSDTRALMFCPMVAALEQCIATRALVPAGTLWRTATSALVAVVRTF